MDFIVKLLFAVGIGEFCIILMLIIVGGELSEIKELLQKGER